MASEDKTLPHTVVVEESQKELLADNQLGLAASQRGSTQKVSQTLAPVQAGEEVPAGQAAQSISQPHAKNCACASWFAIEVRGPLGCH